MPQLFISHRAADDKAIRTLRSALEAEGWTTTGTSDLRPSDAMDAKADEAIDASDLVMVVLPTSDPVQVRPEIDAAEGHEKPVLLLEAPGSAAPGVGLWEYQTIRWDLKDPSPIVRAVRVALEHRPTSPRTEPSLPPAFSPSDVNHWMRSIRMAPVARFEREVAMMLSSLGIELSPPGEAGADFVAWSESTSEVLGNPLGIEIQRVPTEAALAQAEAWLARSGVPSLLLLVGEGPDTAVTSTEFGRLILQLPVLDLIAELGRAPLADAVRSLAGRAGVRL